MAVADFFLDKLKANFKETPTECQQKLFLTLSKFVVAPEGDDILIVSGYAGTGKTSAIASFVRTLKQLGYKFVLLAPTGRAAKVLSQFSGERALTIHKHIYRQKSIQDGLGLFDLDINKSQNTFYIVDEASLITIDSLSTSIFGTGNLLEDLVSYIRSNKNNRLIIIGDSAQLPPVGLDRSPALDPDYMCRFGTIHSISLRSVVRQAAESGILTNATIIRNLIEREDVTTPRLEIQGFSDIQRVSGGELIETLNDAISHYSLDDIVVLCRSNKRANRYNNGIRSSVLFREERLVKGDKLMVVKNCYQFLQDIEDLDFIANGDVAELVKISKYESRYSLNFAEARLMFPDYNQVEITAKVILDTLESETPSLPADQQKVLYDGVYADYSDIKGKRKRYNAVREDLYFNALQIKYATAITTHKSQGGQWKCVFIDNPFYKELTLDDLKWLYTAITRATEKVYLINFKDDFFIN